MTHRLIIRDQAETDITEAALWLNDQRAGLGLEFLDEIEAALAVASATPRRFPRLRRKPEVRRILTGRFPYRIFFILRPDAIIIFRVLHGARHDREWKQNIPAL